jgi:hypothetical protein
MVGVVVWRLGEAGRDDLLAVYTAFLEERYVVEQYDLGEEADRAQD